MFRDDGEETGVGRGLQARRIANDRLSWTAPAAIMRRISRGSP